MPPSDIPHWNAFIERGTWKPRKESIYNAEEWAILCQYKEEYCLKATCEEWVALVRSKILVDMFNYWSGKGVDLNEDESNS